MYLYTITRVCCALIILVISASSSTLKISVADTNASFGCNAVIDSTSCFSSSKNKEVMATLWHPLLSAVKMKHVDVELNPNAPQHTIAINTLSPAPKHATNGFSSEFMKRKVK